uniref:Uncharacterized protein n=1 Tax=Anguilla anguilla TaxID=7936 RepID=A0A0E9R1M8_ANGAN
MALCGNGLKRYRKAALNCVNINIAGHRLFIYFLCCTLSMLCLCG